MTHARHRLNVAGPFYVEDGCCTRCGVPDVTAPELFGEADYTCFVKRQPETTHELGRMLRAMITSEVGCIRYGGVDAAVIRRLAQNGESALADVAPPAGIAPVNRDHVGLRTQAPLTAQLLAESFVSHLGTQPVPFHAARRGTGTMAGRRRATHLRSPHDCTRRRQRAHGAAGTVEASLGNP